MAAGPALYFVEALEERALEPIPENISFTFGWVFSVPNADADTRMIQTSFGTNFKAGACEWNVQLRLRQSPFSLTGLGHHRRRPHHSMSQAHIMVETARNTKILGGSCLIAYTVYHDDDMRLELHSSPKVAAVASSGMITDGLRFRTPSGQYIEKLVAAFKKNEGKKIVVYIEMILPSRYFLRHFEETSVFAHRRLHGYPSDIEEDFRFDFSRNGDYIIKCPDGDLKASRQALFLSSFFFRNYLPSSHSKEIVVRHCIDAVKPIIWYFHSLCFEMPATYDFEFVRRIIDAMEFFHPISKLELMNAVHRSLCQKLADEESPKFDTVLQMASIASRHRFQELKNMACALLANEFYGKFKATFPHGEQNIANPQYRDLFMTQHFIGQTPFDYVEKIYRSGFRTNIIMP
uniref:BTB domain-containing protein n=1 Tax=Panagrolaimus sp. ES5 TaxID=591445 RepID=A0AC34F1A6_9BILA